ncbi:MAG TPA: magnesium transporter [Planctomycetota bacterium]|nr:magnesium transporter [Planctomycetota bacterium]
MARVRRREMRQQVLQTLRDQIEQGKGAVLAATEGLHPADIADVLWMDLSASEARAAFRTLPAEIAAEVLAEAEPQLIQRLTEKMPPEELGGLLNQISADDGADILEEVEESRRQDILSFVEPKDASDLRQLSAYDPETAGGLMTTEFVAVSSAEKIGDVLKRIKRGDVEHAETISTLYLVGPQGHLQGVISARELLEANIHQEVGEVSNPDVISARTDEDQEEIARRILHYNLSTIPVSDARGVLVGIVTSDDALEVLEEEGSEDALLLAGASGETEVGESLWLRVVHRAPMLLITVLAGLGMSRVMNHFAPSSGGEGDWFTILSYIPMVLALSGTVGTQTSAILVRGFAVGQVTSGRRIKVFLGELQVGVALGALSCVIATPAVSLLAGGNWEIGTSLGLALFLAMSWAAMASASIAMGSEAVGLDPALVSGPVMIAVSDLSSVLLFFGVARILLG